MANQSDIIINYLQNFGLIIALLVLWFNYRNKAETYIPVVGTISTIAKSNNIVEIKLEISNNDIKYMELKTITPKTSNISLMRWVKTDYDPKEDEVLYPYPLCNGLADTSTIPDTADYSKSLKPKSVTELTVFSISKQEYHLHKNIVLKLAIESKRSHFFKKTTVWNIKHTVKQG